jgi:hypothetical protein
MREEEKDGMGDRQRSRVANVVEHCPALTTARGPAHATPPPTNPRRVMHSARAWIPVPHATSAVTNPSIINKSHCPLPTLLSPLHATKLRMYDPVTAVSLHHLNSPITRDFQYKAVCYKQL